MKHIIPVALLSLAMGGTALATEHGSQMGGSRAATPGAAPATMGGHQGMTAPGEVMTPGEIRRIDKARGKVTIRHGPIENLGMPKMTMVFRVKDPTMLDQVKPGDKVQFHAEDVNGALTVMRWEMEN